MKHSLPENLKTLNINILKSTHSFLNHLTYTGSKSMTRVSVIKLGHLLRLNSFPAGGSSEARLIEFIQIFQQLEKGGTTNSPVSYINKNKW
ncbi:hypothetical protein GV64_16475 [Endozoicomonas elysicola]|uniref:Uncharacterized protein n=1 Tax=Endozoicomonas elysicola TaxID=305900 RepID=A0A081KD85_9GAMM|nr:hypothetical protein GV64_16475 [Endozoicomonas elysicola]